MTDNFFLRPPRGTKLGEILRTMSFAKSVPEGHKLSECKRGIGGKNSSICYIPEKDPVQEAPEKNKKTNYFKLTRPHMGSKLRLVLWVSRSPEQFILNVRSAIQHAHKWSMMSSPQVPKWWLQLPYWT
jgi:hypothetical protein